MRPTPEDGTANIKDSALVIRDNTEKNKRTSDPAQNRCWTKIKNWFLPRNEAHVVEWLKDMRGMLSVVSTLISTLTFQASINPPGGILQANKVEDLSNCAEAESRACPGAAVLPLQYPFEYHRFQIYNTYCFVSSLSVTLLLVSGVPLNSRFPIWVLSFGMISTLTSLALTYLFGLRLISPADETSWNQTLKIVKRSIYTWLAIVAIVTVILTIRLLVWFGLVLKCWWKGEQLQGNRREIELPQSHASISGSSS